MIETDGSLEEVLEEVEGWEFFEGGRILVQLLEQVHDFKLSLVVWRVLPAYEKILTWLSSFRLFVF